MPMVNTPENSKRITEIQMRLAAVFYRKEGCDSCNAKKTIMLAVAREILIQDVPWLIAQLQERARSESCVASLPPLKSSALPPSESLSTLCLSTSV